MSLQEVFPSLRDYLIDPLFIMKIKWDDLRNKETYQIIKSLPKIDLHCHFGGCQRKEDLVEIANTFDEDTTFQAEIHKFFLDNNDENIKNVFSKGPNHTVDMIFRSNLTSKHVANIIIYLNKHHRLNLLDEIYKHNKSNQIMSLINNNEPNENFYNISLEKYTSLGDWGGSALFQTQEAIKKGIKCLIEFAKEHNVKYLELRFNPLTYTREGHLNKNQVIHIVKEAIIENSNKNLIINIICIAGKPKSIDLDDLNSYKHNLIDIVSLIINEHNLQQQDVKDIINPKVVGFDLAGIESVFNLNIKNAYSDIMNFTRKEIVGLHEKEIFITIHCGEVEPDPNLTKEQIKEWNRSIWNARYYLNADRLGHALRLHEAEFPQDTYKKMNFSKKIIELCPSSNCQTGNFYGTPWIPNKRLHDNKSIPQNVKLYPIEPYLKENLVICINTDNPAISKTDWTKELFLASELCPSNLSLLQIIETIYNGIQGSFLNIKEKNQLLNIFNDEFKKFIETYCIPIALRNLNEILKKYYQKWFNNQIKPYNSNEKYSELEKIPLISNVELRKLPNEIKYLFGQDFVQRLKNKQLGLNILGVSGSYSTLEHSIGTLCIGIRFLDGILKNNDIKLDYSEKLEFYIALFFKHIADGPFNHILESFGNNLLEVKDPMGRIQSFLFKEYLTDNNNPIRIALNNISPIASENFIKNIVSLVDHSSILPSFLNSILDSLIDADRLDYVIRDRYHCGLPSYFDFERLYNLFSDIHVVDKNRKILFSSDSKLIIIDFLGEQALTYLYYSDNDEIQIRISMLSHVFHQFLSYYDLFKSEIYSVNRNLEIKSVILKGILKLSDNDFIYFLREIGEPWYAIDLLNNSLSGKLYKICEKWRFNVGGFSLINHPIDTSNKDFICNIEKFVGILSLFNKNYIFKIEEYFWRNFIIQNQKIHKKIMEISKMGDKKSGLIEIPQVFFAFTPTFYNRSLALPLFEYPKDQIHIVNKDKPEDITILTLILPNLATSIYSYSLLILIPEYLYEFKDFIKDKFNFFIKAFCENNGTFI